MESTPIARITWGTALALFPEVLLRCLPRTPPSRAGRAAVRALGVRHLLQGAATARGLLPPVWRTAPDTLHAASMAGLALTSERWRTVALTDFCVACAFALSSARDTRGGRIGRATGWSRPFPVTAAGKAPAR